ncbi:reticulon-1-A [Eurytemora carolleeae]|uniref:reticulon-1-A n=1 Tax=Eurytemora carolleeae TaxID=1294199 RepID=UPI000C7680C0|nr:reticulon-1-A [Eurytemora carolleeae]|eukprot:XP_023321294.1 reticulon-1-A-like [Eurytemora affinis]
MSVEISETGSSCPLMKLLQWEDPVKTGSVFVPVSLVLVSLSIWSLVSVVAWSCLLLILAVILLRVFNVVMVKLGKPNPLGNPLESLLQVDIKITDETVGQGVKMLVNTSNSAVHKLKNIILVEDILETVKFGTLCYTLTYIGSWFNALTLVLLAWVMAFLLPKLYLNHQTLIDELLGKVKEQIGNLKEKVYKQEKQA